MAALCLCTTRVRQPYNCRMCPRLLVLPLLLAASAAWAQADASTLEGRKNQRVERIHVEDSGARIDEIRYGGQTVSVTVQPKANLPEYEMLPTDLARSRPGDSRDSMGSATGQRVWNPFRF